MILTFEHFVRIRQNICEMFEAGLSLEEILETVDELDLILVETAPVAGEKPGVLTRVKNLAKKVIKTGIVVGALAGVGYGIGKAAQPDEMTKAHNELKAAMSAKAEKAKAEFKANAAQAIRDAAKKITEE